MEMSQDQFDQILFFEHACKTAEVAYAANPLDADNLTRWGGALLELSSIQKGDNAIKMVKEAVSKLEEALEANHSRHDTLWCLGNAHTSQGFYMQDNESSMSCFHKATQCFQQAVELDPGNDLYKHSLDLSAKAPELHQEFQKQMEMQQASQAMSSASSRKASKKKKEGDRKYDILGWVILAVGIVTWVGMAKSQVPPPPPR